MTKKEIRNEMKKTIQHETTKRVKDLKIQYTLIKFLENYKTIALYKSMKNEVELDFAIDELNKDKEIYLPVVENGLVFRRFTDFSKLVTSNFGIGEPKEGDVKFIDEIEVMVVPCLAINKQGYRIGYGKGYYDRALENYKGIKIATLYKYQIVDEQFQESHDIKVDYVITEDGLFKIGEDDV